MKQPTTIPTNFQVLPKELQDCRIWVVWEWLFEKGNWTKPPLIANGSKRRAKSNNPKTWRTFAEALKFLPPDGGIGFCLFESYCAFDLDCCRDRETGEIAPWAQAMSSAFLPIPKLALLGKAYTSF